MADDYTPSEQQIAKVLEKYTPRQIAIAYLRASRKRRAAETTIKVITELSEARDAARTGDFKGVVDGLEGATKILRSANEATEGQS